MSYTVLGDAPAVAEHLEGTNKDFGTRILITEETRRLAGSAVETREIASVDLPGEEKPQPVFELLARAGELPPEAVELCEIFHYGLTAWRERDWDRATERFEQCLRIAPDDGPTQAYLERLPDLRDHPPPGQGTAYWKIEL